MKHYFVVIGMSLSLLAAGAPVIHGYGYFPPPPTPQNFQVSVTPTYVSATWALVPRASTLLFKMDGKVIATLSGTAQAVLTQISVDVTVAHQFTLTAVGITGKQSIPATFTYQPVPAITPVAYQFTNSSSTGPWVTGYITFNPNSGGQVYVSAAVGPTATATGVQNVKTDTFYIVAAKGFITTGAGINCTPQLQYNGSLANKLVVATFSNAQDPSQFSCTLAVTDK